MQKVLIVEDSPAMRGLIASVVDDVGGCDIVEATNGFEALRSLPSYTFDLIITDINMPDINGLELVSFIRKGSNSSGTPVLIVSSEASARDRERGMALGANAYVTKPFSPQQLATIVCQLLGRG